VGPCIAGGLGLLVGASPRDGCMDHPIPVSAVSLVVGIVLVRSARRRGAWNDGGAVDESRASRDATHHGAVNAGRLLRAALGVGTSRRRRAT